MYRAPDERRINGSNIEIWFLILDEFPSSKLCEFLGSPISIHCTLKTFLHCDWVPILLHGYKQQLLHGGALSILTSDHVFPAIGIISMLSIP